MIRTSHMGFCRGDACNSRLALPHGNAGIKFYNLTSGDEIGKALVSDNGSARSNVTAIKFASTAGERVLAAYEDGEVRLYNVEGEKFDMMMR